MAIASALTLYSVAFTAWQVLPASAIRNNVVSACSLAVYPAAYLGVGLLARRRVSRLTWSALLDALIAGGGAFAVALAALFPAGPVTPGGLAESLRPMGDLILLALVVGLSPCGGLSRSWGVALGGLLLWFGGDVLYLNGSGLVASGTASGLAVALWIGGAIAVCVAAWLPDAVDDEQIVPWASWRSTGVPTAVAAASIAVLVLDRPYHSAASTSVAALVLVVANVRSAVALRTARRVRRDRRLSRVDETTGILNRRGFFTILDRALRRAREFGGTYLSVVLFDVAQFKNLNNALGPYAGDRLLRQIAQRLAVHTGGARLGRLAGAEFACVLIERHPQPGSRAAAVAEACSRALEAPFSIQGIELRVDMAIGIATSASDQATAETLVQQADIAATCAKAAGTTIEGYTGEMDAPSIESLELLQDLRSAVDTEQFVLYYQPQADPRTGVVVGVEALSRWQHPTRGLLGPDQFIELAERAGVMGPLTLRIIERAVVAVSGWRCQGHRQLSVAVNLAEANVVDAGLPAAVEAILQRHDVPAEALTLEITEETVLVDPQRTVAILRRLRDLGVKLAIDDFGRGYSSLWQLKLLPVSELKIDKSFVQHLDDADIAVIDSAVTLAGRLRMRVVAEGVETAGSWKRLADLGCDRVQGYFLAKPMPGEQLVAWLHERQPIGTETRTALRAELTA